MTTSLSKIQSATNKQSIDTFGGELVGRLLSLPEIDGVSGAYGQCSYAESSSYRQISCYQQSGGAYTMSG